MGSNLRLIEQMKKLAPKLPPELQRETAALIHKIEHPMKDILALVPGGNLTERAKKLKVSRQTMYVWANEKYRPTMVQAKRIAKVTGVPVEDIVGGDGINDARRKARKKTARLAKPSRKVARRHRRPPSEGQGTPDVGDDAQAA